MVPAVVGTNNFAAKFYIFSYDVCSNKTYNQFKNCMGSKAVPEGWELFKMLHGVMIF